MRIGSLALVGIIALMPLNPNALITLGDAKAFLNIKSAEADTDIEVSINDASTHCDDWCRRPLKKVALTNERIEGPRSGRVLYLRGVTLSGKRLTYPVSLGDTLTVTVDGELQTLWTSEADGDPADKDVIVHADRLYRYRGWCPLSALNPYNVLLTLSCGYDEPIPGPIQRACKYVVQELYARDQQKQLTTVQQLGFGQAGSQVTYATPSGYVMPWKAVNLLRFYADERVG